MNEVKTCSTLCRWLRGAVMSGVVVLIVVLAFVWADTTSAQSQGRVIYMATVEPRGAAQQDKEPFPEAALPTGAGYRKTPPDATGRWEVVTYQWSPGTIVVSERETVTLEIVGVNGDMHAGTIPGLVDSFAVKRGQVTRVTFTATKPGLYPITCTRHVPAMQGTLVVLPK